MGGTSISGFFNNLTIQIRQAVQGKIEVPRDVRNSKSGNMTRSGENGLHI